MSSDLSRSPTSLGMAVLAATVLATVGAGCRLHRHGHRHATHTAAIRDPRRIWATGCADSRFVNAAPIGWLGPNPHATLPFAAADAHMQLFGALQDGHLRAVLHGHREIIDITSGDITAVSAVATGTKIIVAWSIAPQGIGLAMISPDGSVHLAPGAHENGLAISDGRDPVLALGSGVLALFYEAPLPWGNGVFVTRYDASTGAQGWLPVPVEGPRVGAHAVTWIGDRWAFVWVSGQKLKYATLGRNAIHTDQPVELLASETPIDHVAAAYGDGRVAVAWSDRRSGDETLYSTAVNTADRQRTGAEQQLSARYDPSATPSLVWDGGAFGMAWWEPVGDGSPRGFFALINREGNRIGTHLQVPDPQRVGLRGAALAWTGRDYLLVNGQDDGSVAARLTGPRGCDAAP